MVPLSIVEDFSDVGKCFGSYTSYGQQMISFFRAKPVKSSNKIVKSRLEILLIVVSYEKLCFLMRVTNEEFISHSRLRILLSWTIPVALDQQLTIPKLPYEKFRFEDCWKTRYNIQRHPNRHILRHCRHDESIIFLYFVFLIIYPG